MDNLRFFLFQELRIFTKKKQEAKNVAGILNMKY